MKVLVTGGAGFIGSHVVEACLKAGHQVVVADNLSSGKLHNLPESTRFYLMDICSRELDRLIEIEKPDIVSHHAAQISVTVSARSPGEDARVNALGLLNVLEACVRHRVRKIVFISTGGAIYGEAEQMPTPESHPAQPLSPYGIHKHLGEQYLRFFHHQHGLDYTILRYANVYGPRQSPHGEAGVVAIFIDRLLRGEAVTIYAYPDQPEGMTRDYVYAGDVAEANLLALSAGNGEMFNIGTGVATSTGQLYRVAAQAVQETRPEIGKQPEPGRGEPRPGDLRNSCLDAGKAARQLGWSPRTDLREGITRTVVSFA